MCLWGKDWKDNPECQKLLGGFLFPKIPTMNAFYLSETNPMAPGPSPMDSESGAEGTTTSEVTGQG